VTDVRDSRPWQPHPSRAASIAAADSSGEVRLWALEVEQLIAIAGTNVTRTMTDAEFRQYLHVDKCQPNLVD
jgi:hypothetical protein